MAVSVEEVYQRLRPIIGKRADRLWTTYMLVTDRDRKARLERLLRLLYAKHVDRSFSQEHMMLTPPPEDVVAGDFPIGDVVYGEKKLYPFGLRRQELTSHVGIAGMTGSGKTNTAFWLLGNLLKQGIPFMILDWKKTYRALVKKKHWKDVAVFTVGKDVAPIGINPLIPPQGTNPSTWLKMISEVIGDAYYVGEGVIYLLNKAIDTAYRKYGVYDGTQERFPTFMDIYAWLKEHKARSSREQQWVASALRTLWSLCFGETGKLFNIPQQYPLEKLLEKNVILELESLNERDKTFFISSMLLWIHYHRLQQPEREQLKHVILIEESHHVLLQRDRVKESIMDVVFREERELGGAFVWIDQQASRISKTALANTGTFIAMNTHSRSDMLTAANTLLLDKDEAGFLAQLKVGQAIVRSRHHRPFLIQMRPVDVEKGSVSDEELRESVIGRDFTHSAMESVQMERSRPNSPISLQEHIGEKERALLIDITKHPFAGVVSRYRRLGMSVRNGTRLKESIVDKKLAEEKEIRLPDGKLIGLLLTPKAKVALDDAGYDVGASVTPRLFEHSYWQRRIGAMLKKRGYRVRYEVPVRGDGFVDIVASKDGEDIAWEIEIVNGALANIEKCVKAWYKHVVMVILRDEQRERVRRELYAASRSEDVQVDVLSAAEALEWKSEEVSLPQ